MAAVEITPNVAHDASAAFGVVRGVHESNEARDLNLIIERDANDRFHLRIQPGAHLQQAFEGLLEHDLPYSASELWGHVQACRTAWRTHAVDFHDGSGQPLQDRWDLANSPEILASILPQLAIAGAKLFNALFMPFPIVDTPACKRLREAGLVLRGEMNLQTRWVRITSDSFFVPWCLIYSDRLEIDGSNAKPAGFWGYQHVIEHAPPGAGNIANELMTSNGPIELGLQLDPAIDRDLGVPCLQPVLNLLGEYVPGDLVRHDRHTKRDLGMALRSGPVTDNVLFFCCHAEQEGDKDLRLAEAYLQLSERMAAERITPSDVNFWMDTRYFENHPVVFLNACGTGQLNSIFYAGFGQVFLSRHASSVIGAQTELPAVFAGEFARRFFVRLFDGEKVGRILYDLRREFMDSHQNPLGLIYTLYRGADSRLLRKISRSIA